MASQKVFHISRPLLNKDFKKYQLVPNKLESASVKLSPTELVKKGERKEFSKNYYHLWFFKLNNYFIVDPWNPSIVYWFSKANEVIRGTIAEDGTPVVKSVYFTKNPGNWVWADMVGIFSKFHFLNEYYCLFTAGIGDVQLMYTGQQRGDPDEQWIIALDLVFDKPPEKEGGGINVGFPTAMLDVHLEEDNQTVNVAGLIVLDPEGEKNPYGNVCTIKWYECEFTEPLTGPEMVSKEAKMKVNFQRHLALDSVAVPYYAAFVGDYLTIIIDRDLTGNVYEKEKDRKKRYWEYGYADMKEQDNLGWQQTLTEVNIVIDLPSDVVKEDVECEFKKNHIHVGLTDGTDYLDGEPFRELDPEACFWTFDKKRQVIEILLTKESKDEWTQIYKPPPPPPRPPSSSSDEDELTPHCRPRGRHRGLYPGYRRARRMPRLKHPKPLFFFDHREVVKKEKPPKRTRPIAWNTLENDNGETLFVIDRLGGCVQRAPLISDKFMFRIITEPDSAPLFLTKHDVDGVVWKPYVCIPEISDVEQETSYVDLEEPPIQCRHVDTFHALGYIFEGKRDRKYTACDISRKYAAICNSYSHLFMFRHPGNEEEVAEEYVHTFTDVNEDGSLQEIFGLHVTPNGSVFVLRENSLVTLRFN